MIGRILRTVGWLLVSVLGMLFLIGAALWILLVCCVAFIVLLITYGKENRAGR